MSLANGREAGFAFVSQLDVFVAAKKAVINKSEPNLSKVDNQKNKIRYSSDVGFEQSTRVPCG